MTVETVKVLILIAVFRAPEAMMYFPKLREARRRVAASRIGRRNDYRDIH
jgi:hypothetical protein